jgi:hypothetical protein
MFLSPPQCMRQSCCRPSFHILFSIHEKICCRPKYIPLNDVCVRISGDGPWTATTFSNVTDGASVDSNAPIAVMALELGALEKRWPKRSEVIPRGMARKAFVDQRKLGGM